MDLQKLSIRNFKGIRNYTIEPKGKSLSVFADNKVGKTTLFDAYIWLLFDKDSRGHSTGYFSLKTKEDGEVIPDIEHEVAGVFTGPEVEGSKIELRKVYKEDWVRKRGSAHRTMDGHTTDYYVNGVDVKMSEYQDAVDELIDEKLFRILSDVYYFAEELHKDERRKILKGLFDDVSIEDIISGNDELIEYPEILDGMGREEREKQLKSRRRKLDKQLSNIPDRIDENRRMIEPVDGIEDAKETIAELKEDKETIQGKKSEVKSGGAVADLKVQKQELEAEKQKAKTEHRQQIQENLSGQREKVNGLQDKVDEAESDWRDAKREYETLEDRVANKQNAIDMLEEELQTLRDKEPKPANAFEPEKCPVCEQTMPDAEEHDYEEYLEEFNEQKASDIKETKQELAEVEKDAETVAAQLEIAEGKASKAKGRLSQRQQALERAQAKLKEQKENQPEFDSSEYDEQIEEIEQKIENHRKEKQSQIDKLNTHIKEIEGKIEQQQQLINTAKQNKKAEERIEELRQQQDEVASELDDVEHKLHVIDQFIQAESEYITRKVNDKFDLVEWKMFDEQLNGGIKSDCTAMVDGIPFDAGLNDGHRIRGGIDIINTLAKHYGKKAPVFVDNAESVTSLPENDLQIIALIVNKADKQLRVEEGLPMHRGESELATV